MVGNGPAQRLSSEKQREKVDNNYAEHLQYVSMSAPEFQQQPLKNVPDTCHSSYDFFKLVVDDQFVDQVVEAFQLYADRKNRTQLQPKITHNRVRSTHAPMQLCI